MLVKRNITPWEKCGLSKEEFIRRQTFVPDRSKDLPEIFYPSSTSFEFLRIRDHNLRKGLGMSYTDCCGIKEFHGIYDCTSSQQCLPTMLAYFFMRTPPRIREAISKCLRNQGYFISQFSYNENELPKPAAHIMFAGTVEMEKYNPIMSDLVELIQQNNLGFVYVSEPRYNSNSGHKVIGCMWSPDWKACEEYWEKNLAASYPKHRPLPDGLTLPKEVYDE